MNPLLFMPSPRDIPQVKQAWTKLPYDKFIVKYKNQKEAYAEGREFFLQHEEYDYIVICADDLVIQPEDLETLLKDVQEFKFKQLDGICPLDETMPEFYACQPLGCDVSGNQPQMGYGCWYMKETIPDDTYLRVGHSGAVCRVIERELFTKLTFTGGNDTKDGWFDFGMTKEMNELKVPIMVNTTVLMEHLRNAQKVDKNNLNYGYTLWLQR